MATFQHNESKKSDTIPRTGKVKDSNSHWPVSLTSFLCKIIERIIVSRFHWIGAKHSSNNPVTNSVSQKEALVPILFNVTMADFPNQQKTKALLFDDGLSFSTELRLQIGTGTILQTEIENIYCCGRNGTFS